MHKKINNIIKNLFIITVASTSFIHATKFITIATGGVTGTYYPTGGAICRAIEMSNDPTIKCSVEATSGSIYNINILHDGDIDLAMAQSDTLHQAFNGKGDFKKSVKDLRSVMAIYPELLAFVVRKDSGIKNLTDVKDKIINIDVEGSGSRFTTTAVLSVNNIKNSSFKKIVSKKFTKCPKMLKNNTMDGYFGVFAHPTQNIKESSYETPISIIPLNTNETYKLIKKYPYYVKGIIKAKYYKGVEKDIPTIGVKGVLVTSTTVDEKLIYKITKMILNNFDSFKKQHPALKNITKKSLLEGLTIKQHAGAIKAFKESGLL